MLAKTARRLLGLCFVADAGWYLASYGVLTAYLDLSGIPHAFIWLSVGVYLVAGLGLISGVRTGECSLVLIAWLVLTTAALHHDYSPGGIGGYPNFKASLVNAAIIGSLLLVVGLWGRQPQASPSVDSALGSARALLAGRLILGGYFIVNALWQWFYVDIRMEHVGASGGNPNSVWVAIVLQLLGGSLLLWGRFQRTGLILVAIPLVVSTVLVHGNLGPGAPYPPNVQIHQWFVKSAILAGLLMLAALHWKNEEEQHCADS